MHIAAARLCALPNFRELTLSTAVLVLLKEGSGLLLCLVHHCFRVHIALLLELLRVFVCVGSPPVRAHSERQVVTLPEDIGFLNVGVQVILS